MAFIVRGVIANNGNDAAWAGHFTYVAQPNLGFFQWDGLHKVMRFKSREAALAAAAECRGPLLHLPEPTTIEAIEVEG